MNNIYHTTVKEEKIEMIALLTLFALVVFAVGFIAGREITLSDTAVTSYAKEQGKNAHKYLVLRQEQQ